MLAKHRDLPPSTPRQADTESDEKQQLVDALVECSWSNATGECDLGADPTGDQVLEYVGRAATVIQNSENIAMKLTCAVQAADVNVDTMCVVNAVCATVVRFTCCGAHCALVLCATSVVRCWWCSISGAL